MKKWTIFLAILLLVQVGAAIGLNMNRQQLAPFTPEESLLNVDTHGVDRIVIQGSGDARVVLEKKDSSWLLPDYYGAAADRKNVQAFLDKLAGLKKGLPVATTKEAADRFRVSEETFERHITLFSGANQVGELFVGTSPGFRKVHVRLPGSSEVLAVRFASYEAGVRPEDWLDKKILALDSKRIQRMELPAVTLVRKGDTMTVDGLAEEEESIQAEVDKVVDRVATLEVRAILGRENKPEYRQDSPVLTIEVQTDEEKKRTYVFSEPEKEGYLVLKVSDNDLYFKVESWQVNPLKDLKREKLVRRRKQDDKPADAATTTQEAPKQ